MTKYLLIGLITLFLSAPIKAAVSSPDKGPETYVLDLGYEIGTIRDYGGIVAKIKSMRAQDTIKLVLHNYGGDVGGMLYLIAALDATPAKVLADVDGPSYSAAAVITCHADEITMGPYTYLMFHGPAFGRVTLNDRKLNDLDAYMQATMKVMGKSLEACVAKGILTPAMVQQIKDSKEIYIHVDELKGKVNK